MQLHRDHTSLPPRPGINAALHRSREAWLAVSGFSSAQLASLALYLVLQASVDHMMTLLILGMDVLTPLDQASPHFRCELY
jgi:hypothetical protein